MTVNDTAPALPPQPLDDWFLDLLACPACEQRWPVHLNEAKDTLICACGRYGYPINVETGIPILLVEEAAVLDPDARPENITPEAPPDREPKEAS
jgi:uncharacterized protein YbaR (Trm112 family)